MLVSLLIYLLISTSITRNQDITVLFSRITMKGLILASFLAYSSLWLDSLERGIGLYGGLFNITTFTHTFNIFLLLISAVILTLTGFFPRKIYVQKLSSPYNILVRKYWYNSNIISNKNGKQFKIIEYSLIIVFILCGAMFLISTADLISVFLSIELQSYGLYILCTLYRDSESSTASGLTYFLLGGLSSCFILLGSALLYVNSGTTSLDNIYVIAGITEIKGMSTLVYTYQPYYFHLSLIIMSVGLLFKVSAAPFHFWSPDVYDGIPTIVTTYVAIIAKISIFAFFLELVFYTEYNLLDFSWKNIFIISSLLSLIIGSVLGLTQFRIKRLFAYSTISHVGFILLALSINTTESIQSYIFYILQYSIANLNAFIILITIGYSLYLYVYKDNKDKEDLVDENNSPIQLLNQIKGYFYVNPFIAISLAITLFSFVGIPPLIGFFAKQMILSAALDSGFVFMSLIAILTSVIGAAYYLNLIKVIFFDKHDYKTNPAINNLNLVGYTTSSLESSNKGDIFSSSLKMTNESLNSGEKAEIETIKGKDKFFFRPDNITINGSYSSSISIITLLLLLFIFIPTEWYQIIGTVTLILFKA